MHLFIKYREAIKHTPEVTLDGCIVPRVRQVAEAGIEPALWYKVLVCDAVLVDIDKKAVHWKVGKLPQTRSGIDVEENKIQDYFKTAERLFEEEDCKDFDSNIDELFDTALDVYKGLSLEAFDKDGNKHVYEKVVQLLHVYILPNVRFKTKHHDNVQSVLAITEKEYDRLGHKVEGKCKEKHKADTLLRKMRERIVQRGDFQNLLYISALDKGFIETFLKHIGKDIVRLNGEFEVFENEIDKLRESENEGEVRMLKELRKERTQTFENLNNLLMAREQIKSVISRNDGPVGSRLFESLKGSHDHDMETVYMRTVANLDEMEDEIRLLVDMRLKVTAVREAINLTVKELDQFGFSYGFNQKKGLLTTEADVVNLQKKPETWATLQEQVLTLLNTDPRFRDSFDEFCSKTNHRCQKIISECQLFNDNDKDLSSSDGRHGSVSSMNESDILTDECVKICEDILNHVSSTVWDMKSQLENQSYRSHEPCRFHSNVFITYEELVLEKLLPVLLSVFEECNKIRCSKLAVWISSVTLSQLGISKNRLLGRKSIKSKTSVELNKSPETSRNDTEEQGNVNNQPTFKAESSDVHARGTLDKDMTVDELYKRYNSVADSVMPDSFIGALEGDLALMNIDNVVPVGKGSNLINTVARTISLRKSLDADSVFEQEDESNESSEHLEQKQDDHDRSNQSEDEGGKIATGGKLRDDVSAVWGEFPTIEEFIDRVNQSRTLLDKTRHLTLALKNVEKGLVKRREAMGTTNNGICADELLDIVVVSLKVLDKSLLLKLYAHLRMISPLMPSFMQGGPSGFAISTFAGAFLFLFERMEEKVRQTYK